MEEGQQVKYELQYPEMEVELLLMDLDGKIETIA